MSTFYKLKASIITFKEIFLYLINFIFQDKLSRMFCPWKQMREFINCKAMISYILNESTTETITNDYIYGMSHI